MTQNTFSPQLRPMLFQEVGILENWMFILTLLSYTITHHNHPQFLRQALVFIHIPVICHLQRLALDVVCYDCHWYFCMQVDWYASFKDMSRLLCQVIWITIPIWDNTSRECYTAGIMSTLFNENHIANIMVQIMKHIL